MGIEHSRGEIITTTDKGKEKEAMLTYKDGDKLVDLEDRPRQITVKKVSLERNVLDETRKSEMKGSMDDCTFVKVQISKIDPRAQIFGSPFVDELKMVGDNERKKSRLVAQNYSDDDASSIATKAPTVQRFSKRATLSISASIPTMVPYTRDITQAYIQSHTELERTMYIRATKDLGLPDGYVLQVEKTLYGIPESGLNWYLTYLSHHLETLEMSRAKADPCVIFKGSHGILDGLILLKVDVSRGFGTEKFMD